MNTSKKIIILGTHTLFSDKYFINDEVPRILGAYIEDGFSLELIKVISDDAQKFEEIQMPFWLRESIILVDTFNKQEKLHSESFVIADDNEIAKTFNFNIPVYINFFNQLNLTKFNNADLMVCFGFSSKEFKHFCKTNNILGFENGVMLDKKSKSFSAVAVSADDDNTLHTAEYAMSKFRMAVNSKIYKVKQDNTVIGITFKGRGIKNEIGYLPLLFI